MGGECGFFLRTALASAAADPTGAGNECGIGRVFARLIACGHRRAELPHYTLRQLRLFFVEAERDRARCRAARVADFLAAQSGGRAAKDHISDLLSDD